MTARALRVLKTHHAPTDYGHPQDVQATLTPAHGASFCEGKGRAVYFDMMADQ